MSHMCARVVGILFRISLALLVCAPLGQWAAARQLAVHKPAIVFTVKTAPVVLHARHHARRRFRALRQAKTQGDTATPIASRPFIVSVRSALAGRVASSFVPPPEHPPA